MEKLNRAAEEEMLLEVRDLHTYFHMPGGTVIKAVEGVNFTLKKGKVLGIIGESGSGKSVTSRAIMQIVDKPGKIESGEVIFKGEDLLKKSGKEMEALRGSQISLIFQDPNTSFNPYMTIGKQLEQAFRVHNKKAGKEECRQAVKDALKLVGLNNWEEIIKCYPCQFSAGFRQRIFIAMAMIFKPDLLIADEPTTSLGITIQAEIIQALDEIRKQVGNSVIIITHDFGVVSQFADDFCHVRGQMRGIFAEKGASDRAAPSVYGGASAVRTAPGSKKDKKAEIHSGFSSGYGESAGGMSFCGTV